MAAPRALVLLLLLVLVLAPVHALIHDLFIENDMRSKFFIENFGLEDGGSYQLTVTDFKLETEEGQAGFIVKRTSTEANRYLEEEGPTDCILSSELLSAEGDQVVLMDSPSNSLKIDITPENEGLYNTYFVNCGGGAASFHLHLEQFNVYDGDRSYLSAGQAWLRSLYYALTAVYIGALGWWVASTFRPSARTRVLIIHHLMTLFLFLKLATVFFRSVELRHLENEGHHGPYAFVYFLFAFLKGIMMFVLIALIGTGFSFLKPFLSEKDKKIFYIVIPLQVLDNIAMVIVEETAPGSFAWFTWKDIFRLIDIICCSAILIPIIWSIKHLKEASAIDGKAALNMEKLQNFRHFYMIVVSYIYFTRIIVYLLDATLPFHWIWLGEAFTEAASLLFYCVTGYMFRPVEDNPYLKLQDTGAQVVNDEESSNLP